MSVLRGMRHSGGEAVEENGRVIRAGRRLRVILNRECGNIRACEPFESAVIEVVMGCHHSTEGCFERWRHIRRGSQLSSPLLRTGRPQSHGSAR